MRLQGKVALITGAASGIGRGVAVTFAREGAQVFVLDRNRDAGAHVVDEITTAGGQAVFEQVDVSESAQVRTAMERVRARVGAIDVLMANAGVMSCKTLEETSEDEWDQLHSVNLRGMYLTIKYGGPLVRRPGGVILTTGSIDGLYGAPENAAYAATKGGIIAMSRAAALDYAKVGIRMNCLCPGWINTPMNDQYFQGRPDEQAKIAHLHPVGRLGTPQDIANAALFLATEEASFILGLPLIVDGGITVSSI
jgi:NAD(P)-dependent dehydrogenase (short-subunit alcohol dehydrogenase family)